MSHNLNEALELADKILFLSKGPANVIHEEAVKPSRNDPNVERDADALAKALLKRHPEILSGIAVSDD
ncbi:MAG: hypothetical protein PVI97_14660 [Candidatus Thiodiazotropha sp.]